MLILDRRSPESHVGFGPAGRQRGYFSKVIRIVSVPSAASTMYTPLAMGLPELSVPRQTTSYLVNETGGQLLPIEVKATGRLRLADATHRGAIRLESARRPHDLGSEEPEPHAASAPGAMSKASFDRSSRSTQKTNAPGALDRIDPKPSLRTTSLFPRTASIA